MLITILIYMLVLGIGFLLGGSYCEHRWNQILYTVKFAQRSVVIDRKPRPVFVMSVEVYNDMVQSLHMTADHLELVKKIANASGDALGGDSALLHASHELLGQQITNFATSLKAATQAAAS